MWSLEAVRNELCTQRISERSSFTGALELASYHELSSDTVKRLTLER
jgi:hypothetical protein